MVYYFKLNIWGAFKKAERKLCISVHEPDTDNAGVGECYNCNISEIIPLRIICFCYTKKDILTRMSF